MSVPPSRYGIVGGLVGDVVVSAAQVYDPNENSWAIVGSMALPRVGHSMTVLSDGWVLVTGGAFEWSWELGAPLSRYNPLPSFIDPNFATTLSEVFDPSTGLWSSAEDLDLPRMFHRTVLLEDGSVLVSGGLGEDSEIDEDSDPSSNTGQSSFGALPSEDTVSPVSITLRGAVVAHASSTGAAGEIRSIVFQVGVATAETGSADLSFDALTVEYVDAHQETRLKHNPEATISNNQQGWVAT